MTPGPAVRHDGRGDASRLRSVIWAGHMALPLLALVLLLAAPEIDATWKHNPSHFWLVAAVAFANVVIGFRVTSEAHRRDDPRLVLIGVGFVASAGLFTVHALVTPAVIAAESTAGFQLAMPAGLMLFALFGVWSARSWDDESAARVLRMQQVLRYSVIGLAVIWAFLSVNMLPPLDIPLESGAFSALVVPVTAIGVALYGLMALRYWRLHRLRPSAVSLALVTAAVLLAETMVIVAVGRTWQLSWWLWHLVVLAAYGYVAYAASITFRLEGRAGGLFTGVATEATVEQVRTELRQVVAELVSSMEHDHASADLLAADLGDRLGLAPGQTQLLAGAATAIAAERRRTQIYAAMTELTRDGLSDVTESDLARRTEHLLGEVFATDVRCALVVDGILSHGEDPSPWQPFTIAEFADSDTVAGAGDSLAVAVRRGEQLAGDIELRKPESWSATDDDLLRLFADRLALSYENVRLYRQLHGLFASYVPHEVARRLLADPGHASLGGTVVETTVLFADLRGFTTFAEDTGDPTAIVALLNDYFSAAVPIITAEGGTLDKFVGDALMALFNTPVLQPDHALRAVRAAHRIQQAIAARSAGHPDWPMFRIGVNTGPALVGNIGSEELRNFTAIGDAVNVASRLQTAAEPGQVLIGGTTQALVHHAVRSRPLGALQIKGRAEPVEAFLLEDVVAVPAE